MITKENLKEVLNFLGFHQNSAQTRFKKTYQNNADIFIEVDFTKGEIVYPKALQKESDTTSNFSQNENFVVLECVNRLLEIGYKPEDLVLEKTWTLGHTGKSGRADITIFKQNENKDKEVYCIIECKTAGQEYKKALKDLFSNKEGKQLFSYAAQARSVEWLCLYTSDFDKKITYEDAIIKFKDDSNILNLSINNSSLQTFQKASTTSDFFEVWEETYNKKTYHELIFKSKAYEIGILPLFKSSLKMFNKENGLNIEFQEILRHNNISSRHGAFDILLALFLAKCYDEQTKADNERLDFYYNPFSDDYFSLYKRLLKLFVCAMLEFLKEEVYQPKDNFVAKVLKTYVGKNRAKAQKLIEQEIQEAHLYSAQFFNFKKTYNKKLFNQNGKVLAEVVSLFEEYRFSYSSKEQFLGELFETFLNEGFSQNEGVYFTPVPITRFIWNSLPFEDFIDLRLKRFPKVIDFACGAGHFLTEGVSAISDFCKAQNAKIDDKELSANFYGIDKDERLVMTSQVTMLLNGASEAKIRFIDGLEYDKEFYGENQQIFDILVSNPPYSIKDFKQHLSKNILKGRGGNIPFCVLEEITANSSAIENLFVERLTHILKPNAIAAIVLRNSILTNDKPDIKVREILLENFAIHSIVSFGGKTFGTTGTNTIVLFLKRFDEPPKQTDLLKDSINAILKCDDLKDFSDEEVYKEYLELQKITKEYYEYFLKENPKCLENKYFKAYFNNFEDLSNTKTLKSKPTFKNLEKAEQESIIYQKFFDYALNIEKEKLKFFALTFKQKTLIVKAPNDIKEQEKFLGFVISQAKNKNSGLSESGGLLSDKDDRNAQDKIAYAIKQSFKGEFHSHESFDKYLSFAKTCHLLDFSLSNFDKKINLNPAITLSGGNTKEAQAFQNPFANSKYELVRLRNFCDLNKFKKQTSAEEISAMNLNSGNVKLLPSSKNYDWWTNEIAAGDFINEGEVIALGVARYANIKKHKGKFVSANNNLLSIKENIKNILFDYIYLLLEIYAQTLYKDGSQYPQFDKNKFNDFKIPLPPIEIQKQIVQECEKVEEQYNTIRMSIEEYQRLIKAILVKCGICDAASTLSQADTDKLGGGDNSLFSSLDSLDSIDAIILTILKRIESFNSKLDLDFIHSCINANTTTNSKTNAEESLNIESKSEASLENIESLNAQSQSNASLENEVSLESLTDTKALATLLESLPIPPKDGWQTERIANILLNVEQKSIKIPKDNFLKTGKYPIISQESESLISGYTNLENPINDLPLIVFGDHSCSFKYIDFPFFRGADGTQILKFRNVNTKFMFFVLREIDIYNKEKYERHFKYLKDTKIPLPPQESQEKIIKAIEKVESNMENLKAYKKHLGHKKAKILQEYL